MDISALTAYTNKEFAMFTNKGRRMIIRGNSSKCPVNIEIAQKFSKEGWRWSAHSHPGVTTTVLTASDYDKYILQQFDNQTYSVTVNSAGKFKKFSNDWSDWLPTY